jgi:hypothetical protein
MLALMAKVLARDYRTEKFKNCKDAVSMPEAEPEPMAETAANKLKPQPIG